MNLLIIKNMNITKLDEILNNLTNGNCADFRQQVKNLTKLELLDLIEHLRGYGGYKINVVISTLRSALNY